MPVYRLATSVPIAIDCPAQMKAPIEHVFSGEYETHHDGHGLDILDVGANVGSFAIWASLRWPGSRVHAFEPNPGTFAYLTRNTAAYAGITSTNAALLPGTQRRARFFSRYAGDGEAGLEAYARDTFTAATEGESFEVDVVDPATLRSPDIVKIDIEGGEAAVLAGLDLTATSLVLLEFQNRRNRLAMQETLAKAGFEAIEDVEAPWDPILDYMWYQRALIGDIFGRMLYRRRGQTRLTYHPPQPA